MIRYSPPQVKTKSIWICKSDLHYNVVLFELKAQDSHLWYLNSGCSRHMKGDKSLFTSIEMCDGGIVQFGDGVNSRIIGRGTIYIPRISTFSYVFFFLWLEG